MKTSTFYAKFDAFCEQLENLPIAELVDLYNQYCDDVNNLDGCIYPFADEWFDMFASKQEAARSVFFGEISSWSDEFVTLNGRGNTKTFSDFSARAYILDFASDIYRDTDFSDYIDLSEFDEE